jgi:ABC-2 type transport system permease protein
MSEAPRAVRFGRSARTVFDLALDQMLWSRRSLLVVVLLGLPVVFGVVYRAALGTRVAPHWTPLDLYGWIVAVYYLGHILPLTALFYATSMVSEEVEAKTITYLLARPVPRGAILAGKFAAYLATSLLLALPATVVTFYLLIGAGGGDAIGAGFSDLLRDLGTGALALLSYGALFALLGVYLRRPIVPGLLFVFGWEQLARLPGGLGRLTLTGHLRSLISHRPMEEGFGESFRRVFPADTSLLFLLVVTAALLVVVVRVFGRREYVLQQ